MRLLHSDFARMGSSKRPKLTIPRQVTWEVSQRNWFQAETRLGLLKIQDKNKKEYTDSIITEQFSIFRSFYRFSAQKHVVFECSGDFLCKMFLPEKSVRNSKNLTGNDRIHGTSPIFIVKCDVTSSRSRTPARNHCRGDTHLMTRRLTTIIVHLNVAPISIKLGFYCSLAERVCIIQTLTEAWEL